MLLLLVGAAIAGGVALKNFFFPSDPPPAEPAQEESAGPTEEDLANPTACDAAALELEVSLAADSLPVGQPANIPVTVRNTGEVPCLLEVGQKTITVSVTSGEDSVWSSGHCGGGLSGERRLLLDIDASDTSVVTWPGTRSVPGCAEGQPPAAAGTYRLQVALATENGTVDYEQVFGLN